MIMEENLYAPPKAAVADVSLDHADSDIWFFPVSLTKLIAMTFATLGMYQIYWFYKNCQLIKVRDEPHIIPLARAIFGVVWCYGCFSQIERAEEKLALMPALAAGPWAGAWVVLVLISQVHHPLSWLGLISLTLFIPAQIHVNRLNATVAPGHNPNGRFTGWNWVAVAFGVLIWAGIGLGLLGWSTSITMDSPASR
jgi:hypothetical protein